jgi:CubicO group peptidase (beta-lactamase class C family)
MNIRTFLPLGVAVMLFVHACSLLEPDVEEYTDPETEILREMNNNGIPSIAACVFKDDDIVWERYYGYADVAQRRVPDSSTSYVWASVSKLVVVTAAMQLYEQGLINLHADINQYLPFAVRNPNYPDLSITPYHLLTHTSGLAWPLTDSEVPGMFTKYQLDAAPPLREWLPQYLLPGGRHYVPSVWKNTRPGERELYSNIGVSLLAYLVELVSDTTFNAYCKRYIFEPLEMSNTSYAYADLNINNVATLYLGGQQIDFYRGLCYPSGDLKSSLEDFSHFMIAYNQGGQFKNRRILQEHTVTEILMIRNMASGLCLIWNCTLGNWYGHSGGMDGGASYVEFHPGTGIGLIVVSNMHHRSVYPRGKIHALMRRISGRYQ